MDFPVLSANTIPMKLSHNDIDKLLIDLSGKDTETREKAERFYSENKAEILPQFFAYLDKSMAYIEANKKWIVRFGLLSVILGISGFVMILLSTEMPLTPFFVLSLPSFLIAIYLIGKLLIRRQAIPPSYAYLLNLLNELDDPRFVGYLIDLMIKGNLQTVKIVEPILYRQLSLLRPSHTGLLNVKHYRYLNDQLLRYATASIKTFNEEKALAIMKAYEQITIREGAWTVTTVKTSGLSNTVREAAKKCYQCLLSRAEEVDSQETLLRASENSGGQDELLRAANAQNETQPETLLRVPKEET